MKDDESARTGAFGDSKRKSQLGQIRGTGWDTGRLFFYYYDPKTNIYIRIAAPEYWIDVNGYLHFATGYAGEIIISEGELEQR
jgi:hypothetical protein